LGIVFASIGLYFLLNISILQKGWQYRLSAAVYGLCLLSLYILSTIYHIAGIIKLEPIWYAKLKQLDHIAIYLLISGTYTPIILINFIKNRKRIKLGVFSLVSIWACGICGSLAKLLLEPSQVPMAFTIGTYLFMGWFALLFLPIILKETPPLVFQYLLTGGFVYSFGIFFYVWDSLQFNHAIWHLFALCASMIHYVMVIFTLATNPEVGFPEGKSSLQILSEIFLKMKLD